MLQQIAVTSPNINNLYKNYKKWSKYQQGQGQGQLTGTVYRDSLTGTVDRDTEQGFERI